MSHCMGEAKSCNAAAKSRNRGDDAPFHLTYPMRFEIHHGGAVPLAVVVQASSWKYISLNTRLDTIPLPVRRETRDSNAKSSQPFPYPPSKRLQTFGRRFVKCRRRDRLSNAKDER